MCAWKDENKMKKGRGWPIFKKKLDYVIKNLKWSANDQSSSEKVQLIGGNHR